MSLLLSSEAWAIAGLIFGLRIVEMSLDTIRVLLVLRGRKAVAWGIGFCQSILFVFAITTVLTNLDNFLTALGYAGGFATGNVLGMAIEERLAIGYAHLRIISSRSGAGIAGALREEGYAVTEISGRGKDGMVTMINCSVRRKHVPKVEKIARERDDSAFITAEDVRPLRRGFWRA
ncbi:MAG TPA: DUF5698 domain-containing protein [Anaerolineales bacterium]|nr:DUF5698 domain-containing protein [Anaerolineales bacterium]